MLFDVRPKQVEAKKFIGGEKSFQEIRKWLVGRQYTVAWVPEEELSGGANPDETLLVWSSRSDSGPVSIHVGKWIVLVLDDDKYQFHYILMDDESFHNLYKVPEK